MARIYRKSDRIKLKVDDVILEVAPLSHHVKTEIQQLLLSGRTEGSIKKMNQGIDLAVKHSVKSISGVYDLDGNEYKLVMEGDVLSDESVSDLLSMSLTNKLVIICSNLAAGNNESFVNMDGGILDGVEIITEKKT